MRHLAVLVALMGILHPAQAGAQAGQQVLVPFGSGNVRHHVFPGTNPSNALEYGTSYDDSWWESGPAPFGYPDTTCLIPVATQWGPADSASRLVIRQWVDVPPGTQSVVCVVRDRVHDGVLIDGNGWGSHYGHGCPYSQPGYGPFNWTGPSRHLFVIQSIQPPRASSGYWGDYLDFQITAYGPTLGVEPASNAGRAARPVLRSIAPSPARSRASISFRLPADSPTSLTIHDLQGREVARLVEDDLAAGEHEAGWNLSAARGGRVPDGIYLVRLRTPTGSACARIAVIR